MCDILKLGYDKSLKVAVVWCHHNGVRNISILV